MDEHEHYGETCAACVAEGLTDEWDDDMVTVIACRLHEECDMEPCIVSTDDRADARDERIRNNRKMRVSGRSTLLLSALSSGQQRRRVARTRKRGGR